MEVSNDYKQDWNHSHVMSSYAVSHLLLNLYS